MLSSLHGLELVKFSRCRQYESKQGEKYMGFAIFEAVIGF